MHTAKIHRRKKGASDLEAYQIVIVGNRRLIYHGSTLLLPLLPPSLLPTSAPLSPLLFFARSFSFISLLLYPHNTRIVRRWIYPRKRGNEPFTSRSTRIAIIEEQVSVIFERFSWWWWWWWAYLVFPLLFPLFLFRRRFYAATRISPDLSSSKIAWKHELRTSTRLDATLFAFSYRKWYLLTVGRRVWTSSKFNGTTLSNVPLEDGENFPNMYVCILEFFNNRTSRPKMWNTMNGIPSIVSEKFQKCRVS